MEIDHIFIFTDSNGKEANELVEFGLVEGSSRVHPGQGTVNRKFYFENFFLEILWIHNEEEIQSSLIEPTKLWERANYNKNNFSPFGLCLKNTDEIDKIFKTAIKYQPVYFPQGLEIDVLPNEQSYTLPWTFRLPFKDQRQNRTELTAHKNGLRYLTKAEFGIWENHQADGYIAFFSSQNNIVFRTSEIPNLTLTFDNHIKKQTHTFKELNLTICY